MCVYDTLVLSQCSSRPITSARTRILRFIGCWFCYTVLSGQHNQFPINTTISTRILKKSRIWETPKTPKKKWPMTNERPRKKSHGKGTDTQTDSQTDRQTDMSNFWPTRPRGPSWWEKKPYWCGFCRILSLGQHWELQLQYFTAFW